MALEVLWPALPMDLTCASFPGSSCEKKRADLVFIIDSSRSVSVQDYARVKEFLVGILHFLDVGPDATRVGLLQYASTVKSEFSLGTFGSKAEVERAVLGMRRLSTGTMTGLALQYALSIAFSEAEGARPLRAGVPRVLMIVTDGRPQDSVAEVAARARNAGILIFAIGVGQVDLGTLKAMGSQPHRDHVFLVANFSQIESLLSVFQKKLCGELWPLSPPRPGSEREHCGEGACLACGQACGLAGSIPDLRYGSLSVATRDF